MTLWVLLCIPGTVALLMALLVVSALVEERILSPRALIGSVIRARTSSPEQAERLVALQVERLMKSGAPLR